MDKIIEWLKSPFRLDNKVGVPRSQFLSFAIIWVILVPLSEGAAMKMGDNLGTAFYYRYICLFIDDLVMLGIFFLTVSIVSPDLNWKTKTGFVPVSWKVILLILIAAVPVYYFIAACGDLVQTVSTTFAHKTLPLQKSVVIIQRSSLSHLLMCNFPRSVIFAPVMEELCWRHIVFSFLASRRNATITYAAIMSSLLFAVAHMNMLQAIPLFALGMILQFVYLKTKSVFAPMLLHALCNTITILIVILTKGS